MPERPSCGPFFYMALVVLALAVLATCSVALFR